MQLSRATRLRCRVGFDIGRHLTFVSDDPDSREVPASHGPESSPESPLGGDAGCAREDASLGAKVRVDVCRGPHDRRDHDKVTNDVRKAPPAIAFEAVGWDGAKEILDLWESRQRQSASLSDYVAPTSPSDHPVS